MFRLGNFSVFMAILLFVGCGDNGFKTSPNSTCIEFRDIYGQEACLEGKDGTNQYRYSVRTGEVDILFVVDNSGSMFVEQQKLADRFPGFLDSIRDLSYRIGIVTTDISSPDNVSSQANGFGALQNGKLIEFPHGKKILENPEDDLVIHSANQNHFVKTIQRAETEECDAGKGEFCPSGDERPIYAMNLALESAENQDILFREGGHLAVIVLTDEDERSNGGQILGYPLEELDLPLTFARRTRELLHPTKSVSVHSIAIQPGAQSCFNDQNSQNGVKGYFAYELAKLSQPDSSLKAAGNLIDGHQGSICSSDYTREVGSIGEKLQDTLGLIQLPCDAIDGSFEVTTNDSFSFQIEKENANQYRLNPAIPPGHRVQVGFRCFK